MLVFPEKFDLSKPIQIDSSYFILESVWSYLCHVALDFAACDLIAELEKSDNLSIRTSDTGFMLAKFNANKWRNF